MGTLSNIKLRQKKSVPFLKGTVSFSHRAASLGQWGEVFLLVLFNSQQED